jgi:hypothetical protein
VNLVILNFVDETQEKTKIISPPHLRVSQNLVCEMLDIEEECLPLYSSKSLSFLFMTTWTIAGNNNVIIVGVIFWRLLISFMTGG